MKALTDLKEILEDQVKKIAKKGDINPNELENMYKAVDIIKDIQTIDAMKKAEEESQGNQGEYSQRGYSRDGHSQRYMPPMMYSYESVWNNPQYDGGMMPNRREMMYGDDGMSNDGRRGRDGDGDGRYSEAGNSYRRGRDARGRYTSRDGSSYERGRYSRHSEKERMIEKLEEMADETTSSKERNAIMQCIEKLEN